MTELRKQLISADDSPSIDAFGRLRVSNPQTIFDSKQVFDNQPLFWDEELETGAGITSGFDANEASTTITSTLNTAGKFTRQTFRRFNYQPAKSQLIFMTFVLDESGGGTGTQRRLGWFDDDNGIFLEDNAGTVRLVRRSKASGAVVDDPTDQSSWNLDVMDGTGTSGITIDWTKTQIMVIDAEWLGVGRVRVGLVVDGIVHYVHQFLNANNLAQVYMSTPNLPLRFQVETQATSAASTMQAICCSVISEGGVQNLGTIRSIENGGLASLSTATSYALIGLRLKSANLGATVDILHAAMMATTTNDKCRWSLIFNGTIAGSPSWTGLTNSSVETMIGTTAETISGGTRIDGGFFDTGSHIDEEIQNALKLGADISGNVDTICLVATPITSNITVHASITWQEQS